MKTKTVAILSPGDMGHTIGQILVSNGLRVISYLKNRSERTRLLAKRAHIMEVPTYQALVNGADILLSILAPAQAKKAAHVIAQAISETKTDLTYVDCNAIAPQTVTQIGDMITNSGGCFIDASIIGFPSIKEGVNRLYASGQYVDNIKELSQFGLNIIVVGEKVGQASAVKMCHSALPKGLLALCAEILTAAEALGVSQVLKNEFQLSQSAIYERMERELPGIPMKSGRFIGEMEEIAKTFEGVGLTPKILAGAADIYRFLSKTKLAEMENGDKDSLLPLTQLISILADHLPDH